MLCCLVVSVITFSCLVMGSFSLSPLLIRCFPLFSCMACGGAPHHWSWATVARTADRTHHRNPRHSEVSAWTSRTTLGWTASKTTCSTAQVSVRHLAGKILQGVVAAEAKLRECVLADKINLHSPPPFLETLQHSLL